MDGEAADDPRSIAALIEPVRSAARISDRLARGARARPRSMAGTRLPPGCWPDWGCGFSTAFVTPTCAHSAPFVATCFCGLGMQELDLWLEYRDAVRAGRCWAAHPRIPVPYHRRRGGTFQVAGSSDGTSGVGPPDLSATFAYIPRAPQGVPQVQPRDP